MKRNNYDKLAPYYDRISGGVFGRKLVMAQRSVLPFLKDGDHILIVGGGTGKILDEIAQRQLTGIEVTYLDASEKMIAIAKKYKVSFTVRFVHAYLEAFNTDEKWDVVLTPFFFDNFKRDKCRFLFARLTTFLKKDGLFLYVDFKPVRSLDAIWKRGLLWLMYFFFKLTVHIETDDLVDMRPFLLTAFRPEWHSEHVHGFVTADVFRKI